ncbi:OLC1v1032514C1 [Oldenlandia corymbosa var. corymbosa]|uniref:glycerophosphodiester phosphodiesterase n=1 Tax=Oldenlandia corymbosa var. corymbosa TaxID=529605 RepID=A0AAV1CNW2_OLDCO|nr:OLC1v1032514C1 [Oldenlandia corymbosa var. corymbosa]
MAALKAVHVSDIPNLDQVTENASVSLYSTRFHKPAEVGRSVFTAPRFLVVGHRGNGMNLLQSGDLRLTAIKENSILSFNAAAKFPIDFVEFDVQVTSDGIPVIFHDDFILADVNGVVCERRVTDLSLPEFMSYGVQREAGKVGKSLMRKTKQGRTINWNVETDDFLCTLEEVFEKVDPPNLGFNIELKFDDYIEYQQDHLIRTLQNILKVVFDNAGDRPIIFSSFQPDAALLTKKLQSKYPVYFLTNGGTEIFKDVRMNSLEEALNHCLDGGLQGIVSESKAVFRNPGVVNRIKESKLSLLTYGELNNVTEAVYMQQLMGVEGVIVDLVEHITDSVSKLMMPPLKEAGEDEEQIDHQWQQESISSRPQFSQTELSFLLKLIPELLHQ